MGFPKPELARRTAVLAIAATGVVLSQMSPAAAFNDCLPRLMSKNIRDAVLAMKAAQYCEGLPYTINEAAHQVEKMRCNKEASEIVDNMINNYNAEFKLSLKGPAAEVTCSAAAQISW